MKTFLTAEWRRLAIANYAVDPAILNVYLPYKTEHDFWNDKCYVSLVGFRFVNTRLKGVSVPFHSAFEEINLRFYVRYKEDGIWKRGVTFIKEIVPRAALTFVANTLYREKYVTLPTRHLWEEKADSLFVQYAWKHAGDWDSLGVKARSGLVDIPQESEEEFITEHYWGYTRLSDRLTSQYQVEHPRWQVYPVTDHEIKVRFGELYGAEFGYLSQVAPDSVMLAEGSPVSVRMAGKVR